jgi:hypothetical protein
MNNIFFNAHHSPMGAFASFTLGQPGAKGGLGLELGKPAEQNIFIGCETNTPNVFEALPFYAKGADESARFDVENAAGTPSAGARFMPFERATIHRDFNLGTDAWRAGDLTFRIYSPVAPIPEPGKARARALPLALVPAVLAELTVDNTAGTQPRRAFFGYQGNDPYSSMRRLEGPVTGVAQGRITAIATTDNGVRSGQGFGIENAVAPKIEENLGFGLGGVGALTFVVPAGKKVTKRFAICFYRGGLATAGLDARYLYTRWFQSVEDVAAFALKNFAALKRLATKADALVNRAKKLSANQKFQLIHATRAYYGSTELLERKGKPVWVVNEGEYRMMNTFDLTVDHLFFEMKFNPWVVRNALEMFVSRYSYRDQCGLSFTHDMGIANTFSRPGYSTYECFKLDGCFSHMTHEQLVNWVLCASGYVAQTGDRAWFKKYRRIFVECLESLINRDAADPAQRDGVMGVDSHRCLGGAEITTYDSLDVSLGQARNNLYLAVKTWAAYLALERWLGSPVAGQQADRCAATICAKARADGTIPAVFENDNQSLIIPAIEGLVFPEFTGCAGAYPRYATLVEALRRHVAAVLVPGKCLFADGAWKMSSTSDNSWLSKIYLCQYVYRHILGFPWDEAGRRADAAHVSWLTRAENTYWGWSDQIVAGLAKGSKYYPRGVTSILWLNE